MMTYTLEQVQSLQDKMTGKLGNFYSGLNNVLGKLSLKLPTPMEFGKQIASFSAEKAMNFDQGIARINMVARLDEKGLGELKEKLKNVVKENKADIEIAPAGLEKIISQVRNTDQAIKILDASLKGSKAGFTDLDTVSGALTQSLSAIGQEKGSTQEVLDVFFAAQRIGNSNFGDIAHYMPSLISGASGMGFGFKEAAGAFAYMTSKGHTAEQAAGMLQSAFTALSSSDIQSNMQNMGVGLTDQEGSMRTMVDLFGQLSALTSGMSEQQKTSIFESLGLNDENALGAFSLLTSDMQSFQQAIIDTGNASGETDAALQLSSNTVQQSTELWNKLNTIGASLGEIMLPAISTGLSLAGIALDGLSGVVDLINGFMSGWFTTLQDGNPVIWGITAAIGILTAIYQANNIQSIAMIVWDGIVATGKWALATAQWALNTAFSASPIGWIILGVSTLAGVIAICWQKFDFFRGGVYACWDAIKGFGKLIKDCVIDRIKELLSGISGIGDAFVKLFNGDFSGAWEAAKKSAADIVGVGTVKNAVSNFKGLGKEIGKAYDDGINDFKASQKEKDTKEPQVPDIPEIGQPPADLVPADPVKAGIPPADKLSPKPGIAQSVPANNASKVIDLNEPKPIRRESTEYTAAIDKLSPSLDTAKTQTTTGKLTGSARKMAAVATIPLAMSIGTPGLPAPGMNEGTDLTETASPMGQSSLLSPDNETPEGRTILIDRICDNIIINVANTDEKGTDEIKGQLMKLLNDMIMYEL